MKEKDIDKYRITSKDFGYEVGEDLTPGKKKVMGNKKERKKTSTTERMNFELNVGE